MSVQYIQRLKISPVGNDMMLTIQDFLRIHEKYLVLLAVSIGCVDVQGSSVQATNVGRTFTRCIDHIEFGKKGNIGQIAIVTRSRQLLLKLLLTFKLMTQTQFG